MLNTYVASTKDVHVVHVHVELRVAYIAESGPVLDLGIWPLPRLVSVRHLPPNPHVSIGENQHALPLLTLADRFDRAAFDARAEKGKNKVLHQLSPFALSIAQRPMVVATHSLHCSRSLSESIAQNLSPYLPFAWPHMLIEVLVVIVGVVCVCVCASQVHPCCCTHGVGTVPRLNGMRRPTGSTRPCRIL